MKLQERVNEANINETVADIIVAKMRSRFRKTGKRASSYDKFEEVSKRPSS